VGKKRTAYGILVGKPEGHTALGRLRHKWTDTAEIDLRERYHGVVWAGLMWLRIGTGGRFCEHGNEPLGSIKYWKVL
jgi:hypothetical protein